MSLSLRVRRLSRRVAGGVAFRALIHGRDFRSLRSFFLLLFLLIETAAV